MNRNSFLSFATALVALMGLSACGGGGGGSSGLMPERPGEPVVGGTPAQLTETQLYGDLDAYRAVGANRPNFGSFTQSSNGNGISTDRVETTLESGGHLTLVVRDGNGDVSVELNSRADLEENLNGTAWLDDSELPPNFSGNGWVLSKREGADTTVAVAYTIWEDTDATNYLAGGYWAKVANDEVTELGTFGDAGPGSVFSYWDGQSSSWERPITGTASYYGSAEGAYVAPDGDGGIWWSRLLLNAEFATNSISGCIGCPQAAPQESGVYTYTTLEDLKADRWTREDLYVALRSGSISNDGSFEGTLKVFELSSGTELPSSGRWGGLFSENDSASTHPSQVVGTLGGTADDIGFIGVFTGQRSR